MTGAGPHSPSGREFTPADHLPGLETSLTLSAPTFSFQEVGAWALPGPPEPPVDSVTGADNV